MSAQSGRRLAKCTDCHTSVWLSNRHALPNAQHIAYVMEPNRSAEAHLVTTGARANMTARRWEVLSATATAFAAHSYHGVGMREIAQSLNLNQGTLYHHFKSKDHALLAICMVGHERTLADLVSALNETGSFAERVRSLARRHVRSLGEIGDFLQGYIDLRDHVPYELGEPLRIGWAAYRARLKQLFEDGVRNGEISPDVDLRHARWMLISIYRTLNQLHRLGRQQDLEGFARSAPDIFLYGMTGAGSRKPN